MSKGSRQWLAITAVSMAGLILNTFPANAQDKGSAKESSAPQTESTSKNSPNPQAGNATTKKSGSQSANASGGGESANGGKSDTNAGQGKTSAKNATGALPPGHPVVGYLMVPLTAPENKEWMKKGCWAKFHDGENFSGDMLTLMGPVDMPDMKGPFGIDWKGKISSVETGPKARVMVYDNENYKDLVATFKPGQKSNEVSKKLGFFDEFSSMKILCPGT